jgi:hypothetical protein
MDVPKSLRAWFLIHWIVDWAAALPLFAAPTAVLTALGMPAADPLAVRLVAAALFAIGGVSLFQRNADASAYRALLTMKAVWAGSAVVATTLSLKAGAPPVVWGIVAMFLFFGAVWTYYLRVLKRRT